MINSFFNDPVVQEAMRANYALGEKYMDKDIKKLLDLECSNSHNNEQTEIVDKRTIHECRAIGTDINKEGGVPYPTIFNWGNDSNYLFPKLKQCGFELRNALTYENSIRLSKLHDQAYLFQDLEFRQVFKILGKTTVNEKNGESYNHILVRIYKVERVGTIKMKQAIFSKLKNLKRCDDELVTITHAKEYNINVPYPNGYDDDILVPYCVVGMLLVDEYNKLVLNYYENDHLYLDGVLPAKELEKKERLRHMFVRTTGREIFPYLNEPITRWKLADFNVDIAKTYNHKMIEMSTYHD